MALSDDYKIYVDASRPATLNNGAGVLTDCATLQEAVLAWSVWRLSKSTDLFPKRFLPKERWNNAAMAEAMAEIEKHLAILEKHLAGKNYLVAEQFSLADVCYAPFLEFLPLMEITPSPTIAAWSERLLARPSMVATRPEN